MEFGNYLIIGSIILALIGIVFSFIDLFTRNTIWTLYSRIISMILFFTITAAMLLLYYLFITTDVSVSYVWSYTDTSYSLAYRISGTLAGMAGSLLFWVWMVIIPWFYEEMRSMKKEIDSDFMNWARIFTFSILAILLFILSTHEIFSATDPEFLAAMPNGNGLNPILQTFLMTIHPPIIFVSYGFLVMPLAAGLAYLITGDKKWTDICLDWSRLGWFFLTLGIGIGALWAYVVLGWGGYWAWDPVETSSLLPWILLTGFLHTQLMYKRKKDYPILAPVLGSFTFILVIFATFATRAGGLWVSVHTFGHADVSVAAWTRFTTILADSDMIAYYFASMVGFSAITMILAMYRRRKMGLKDEDKTYTLSELINDDILMLATSFLLILMTAVTFLILVRGVDGLAPENFDVPVGILTIILIMLMGVCVSWRILGRKTIAKIGIIMLVASGIAIVLYQDNTIVAGTIPILLITLVMVAYTILKRLDLKRPWHSLKLVSAHLIHLSIVILVIGYVSSTFLVSDQVLPLRVGDTSPVSAFGYDFKATSVEGTSDYVFTDIEVWQGNKLVGKVRPGISVIDGQMRSEVKIVDTAFKDIYLIYDYDQTSYQQGVVDVEVKILPMMKLLWGGMWLMSIGIILRMVAEFITKNKKSRPDNEDEPDVHEGDIVKDDEYYESMLEAELEMVEDPEIEVKDMIEAPETVEK